MKNLVLLLVAAALAAVLLVFLLIGGWSTVHQESVSKPEPIVETTREAAVRAVTPTSPPTPAGHASQPTDPTPDAASAVEASLDGQDLDEPVTHKKPQKPSAPDALFEPEKFREKLQTENDPLLPAVEQLLAARGFASTPASASAAWDVARKWAIYRQAEGKTKVDDPAALRHLVAARKKILIDEPREALTRILGGKVEAGLWTDLEALGMKHQPPPRSTRSSRRAGRAEAEGDEP